MTFPGNNFLRETFYLKCQSSDKVGRSKFVTQSEIYRPNNILRRSHMIKLMK